MKYFRLSEFFNSAKAQELGINNTTSDPAVIANIETIVDNILDPLREAWGKPITVNSGYRCAALNRAVCGSPSSQHTKGMAADITTGNRADNRRLFQMIVDMKLPYDQLIDEKNFAWVHVSYSPRNRRQILKL